MSRIEPYELAPLVGFACWHLEHGASVEETMERLRRHEAYCQFSDEALRKVVRRALSDLKHWQKIRHCCGWTERLGPCSFDEAEQEMQHRRDPFQPAPPGVPYRGGHAAGDC